jgi:hypothetical protein
VAAGKEAVDALEKTLEEEAAKAESVKDAHHT